MNTIGKIYIGKRMASVKYEVLFSPENSPCSDDNDQTIFTQNLYFHWSK